METNWNKIIERYLQGELSPDGIEAFEFELGLNPDLRAELDIHKLIHESLFRSAERLAIQNIGKKYHFKAKLKKWLTYTSVVTATATTIALVAMNSGTKNNNDTDTQETKTETVDAIIADDSLTTFTGHDNAAGSDSPDVLNDRPLQAVTTRTRNSIFLPNVINLENNAQNAIVGGDSPNTVSKSNDANSMEKPEEKQKDPEQELPKVLEDKKLRFMMTKGLLNPADIKTEEVQRNFPTGTHLTLGNFKVYSSSEGIVLHNFITDDVIVLGKTPADQVQQLVEKNKYKSRPPLENEDSESKPGNIYIQR